MMVGNNVITPIKAPKLVLRSGKNDPVDTVSKSDDEMEEIVGDVVAGRNSVAGCNIIIIIIKVIGFFHFHTYYLYILHV